VRTETIPLQQLRANVGNDALPSSAATQTQARNTHHPSSLLLPRYLLRPLLHLTCALLVDHKHLPSRSLCAR
jgi:hypothetical protein